MTHRDISTFWLLYGKHGQTMTIEELRDEFFPNSSLKTMSNHQCGGLLPKRTGNVYDIRDVADWWDEQRRKAD